MRLRRVVLKPGVPFKWYWVFWLQRTQEAQFLTVNVTGSVVHFRYDGDPI